MTYLEYFASDPAQSLIAYSALCHAHQQATAAFAWWLRERSAAVDVQHEVDATSSVFRQLAELEAGVR